MRTIKKLPQPTKRTEWRLPRMLAVRPPGMECDYDSLRRSPDVLEAVEDGLFAEQGGICAYTGLQISITPADPHSGANRDVDFHVEHLTPRKFCNYGQDADYTNMVACWPRPNCGFEPAYGARKKDEWPSPSEQALFVSPLRLDCSWRFKFNHRGEIAAARNDDAPAVTTIERLGLDHPTLNELRRNAIRGALNPASRRIRLAEAQKILAHMQHTAAQLDAGVSCAAGLTRPGTQWRTPGKDGYRPEKRNHTWRTRAERLRAADASAHSLHGRVVLTLHQKPAG